MSIDQTYLNQLERLVKEKLLPAYVEYCALTGTKDTVSLPVRKIPALLDKDFGVSVATSNVRKPRKN